MRACLDCGSQLEDRFRFCPFCGTPQRVKVIEYFRGHDDIDDGALRVSAYLTRPQHVRLSIWRDNRVEAALSLEPAEAHRLARFLLDVIAPRRAAAALRSVFR